MEGRPQVEFSESNIKIQQTQLRVRLRKSNPKGEDACVDFGAARKEARKIRNSEYYGMESIFDTLYAESRNGKTFNHLMAIIESEENIKLAYRTIKRNHGSKTPGVDKKTIRNLAN